MHAPAPLFGVSPQSQPSGFIEHVVRSWRLWWTERHYRSVLGARVRDSLDRLVGSGNGGPDAVSRVKLLDVLVPDFSQTIHPHLRQLEDHVEAAVRGAATNVIAAMRSLIDLNVRAVDDLQAEVVDSRSAANATHDLADPPAAEPVDEGRIQQLKLLKHHRARRLRLRIAAAAAFVLSGISVAAEGTLVHGSLLPMFSGVAGIPEWMLPLQALVITMGMVFVAHQSRLSSGTNTDWRWISRASLCLIALAMAGLRAGILVADGESTAGVSALLESWGLLLLTFVAGVVLAVFAASAFERAGELLRRADDPQSSATASRITLEAAIEAEQERQHGRQVFERRRREFHRRAVQRTRRLETELRRTHRSTQQLLRGEIRRVLPSLSPMIKQASRCLARWRHGPESLRDMAVLRQRPLLAPFLIIGIGLLGASCSASQLTVPDQHVLLDTSGSIPPDTRSRIQEHVVQQTRSWARTATSGSSFTIWWLSSHGDPYPARRMTIRMPSLEVPAHRHRQRLVDRLEQKVRDALDELPRAVSRTELLESLYYIGSTADRHWHLTVYSDLLQDSERWDRSRLQLSTAPENEVVTRMLELCPPITVPPTEVVIRTWPGLVTSRRAGIYEHQRYRKLFEMFFNHWAPSASVRLGAIG